jgi:hypothetical protein
VIRPGLVFVLWLAISALVVVNDTIADTWIAVALPVQTVEWYKVLVPLPYVVLLAIIHARRSSGPRWFEAALLAALLWPPSTIFVDYLYGYLTFGEEPEAFVERFAFWWGAPYGLLAAALFATPLVAGGLIARRSRLSP